MDLLLHEEMARSIPDGVDLTDEKAVIMALVAAGWRPNHIEALVDQVISYAISERDASSGSYGATSAVLDCIATAALFGGGTTAFFVANILDASVSSAMASTLPTDICSSIEYAAGILEVAALGAAGTITFFWFLVWSMAWRRVPVRAKRRRPF